MKVVFLDIDGVLNSESWARGRFDKIDAHSIAAQYPYYEFDPESVKWLNYITEETGAKIVISSTWRLGRTIQQLNDLLKFVCVTGEIIDITTYMRATVPSYSIPRGCEIEHWLEQKKFQRINYSREVQLKYMEDSLVENYVILDDDSDMLYNQREHYVRTSRQTGLNEDSAKKSVEILKTSIVDLYYKN